MGALVDSIPTAFFVSASFAASSNTIKRPMSKSPALLMSDILAKLAKTFFQLSACFHPSLWLVASAAS